MANLNHTLEYVLNLAIVIAKRDQVCEKDINHTSMITLQIKQNPIGVS